MALLGNYSILSKNPGRSGATTAAVDAADYRAGWNKSGANRNRYVSPEGFAPTSAVPNGYSPPGSWQIAVTSGGISSYTIIGGAGALAAGIAGGKNATADLAGSGSITNAEAALIVSAVATLTGSGAITAASANAILDAVATLTGSGTVSGAALVALGNAVAALTGSGTVTPTINATGELAADLTPFTELSPQSLAAAVWNSVAAAYDDPATFGAQAAFLYALGHNKVVTDPAAGTFTVYDTDDTTVLYVADLWQDAAGTTPYSGSGAERRDQLA